LDCPGLDGIKTAAQVIQQETETLDKTPGTVLTVTLKRDGENRPQCQKIPCTDIVYHIFDMSVLSCYTHLYKTWYRGTFQKIREPFLKSVKIAF
jgi:hypothetical protein